ncbi:MAG: hypothetical protein FWH29_02860 [Methanobrevibacter sp.]|nr:hypothetical protein [Methanobrevibacter sp.]
MNTSLNKQHIIDISIKFNLENFSQRSLEKIFTNFWKESNLKSHVFSSEIIPLLKRYKRLVIKKLLKDKHFCGTVQNPADEKI